MKKLFLIPILAFTLILPGCGPIPWATIISIAESIAQLVLPFATAAPIVAKISQEAVYDLQTIEAYYTSWQSDKTNPTKIEAFRAAVEAAQQKLPNELVAAHITDPKTVSQVFAAVNLVLDAIDSYAALVPATAQSTTLARARRGASGPAPSVMSRKELISRWDTEVCRGDIDCIQLVN